MGQNWLLSRDLTFFLNQGKLMAKTRMYFNPVIISFYFFIKFLFMHEKTFEMMKHQMKFTNNEKLAGNAFNKRSISIIFQ